MSDKPKYSLIHPNKLEMCCFNSYKEYINGYYKYKITELKREQCNNYIVLDNGKILYKDKQNYIYDINTKKCVLRTQFTVTICPDDIKLEECKITNPFNLNELLR